MFIFYFNVYDQKATRLENFQIITGLQGPWCEFPKDRNDHKEGSRPEKYNFATYDLGTHTGMLWYMRSAIERTTFPKNVNCVLPICFDFHPLFLVKLFSA